MKHFRMRFLFAFVAVVATLAFFSCKGNGQGGDKPSKPITPKDKVMLKFDANKIVARNVDSSSDITTESEVEVGTKLLFSVVPDKLDKNKVFDGFRINGDKKRIEQNEVYVVSAADSVNDGGKKVLNITFVEREISQEKVKIIFASDITAKKGDNAIQSGELVQEGTEITFVAGVPEEKILDSWLINDKKREGDSEDRNKLSYTVNLSHARDKDGSKEIEVKFTTKNKPNDPDSPAFQGDKVVMEFDPKQIILQDLSSDLMLQPGNEVGVGTKLFCNLRGNVLAENEIFDGFFFNKKKLAGKSYYTVSAEDAVKRGDKSVITITISKRKKTQEEVKIVFGENIEAKEQGYYGHPISTGEEVEDGTRLEFDAQVSDGKMVEAWFINGKKEATAGDGNNSFVYVVDASKAKTEGNAKVIEVTFTETEAKTIYMQFDETFIPALVDRLTHNTIAQNEGVKVGTEILIDRHALKISQGQIIDSWLLNEKKTLGMMLDGPYYRYIVDAKDAKKEGEKLIIKIGLKLRAMEKVKLKFDDANINALEEAGPSKPAIEYKNGDLVDEGKFVIFLLKDNDKIVEKWLCNKKEYTYPAPNPNSTGMIVNKTNAKKDGDDYVIHMEAETRDIKSFTLKFDPPITCMDNDGPSGKTITSGTSIKEDEVVFFSVMLPQGQTLDNWIVNEEVRATFDDRSRFRYRVNATDAKDGVIEVKISSRTQKSAKLVLGKTGIKVRRSTQQGPDEEVNNGSEVKEGDRLRFHFELKNKIVEKWIINGKKYAIGQHHGDNFYIGEDGTEMNLRLESRLIVEDGGDKVIKVSYEERDPEEIKIEFDEKEMECKNYQDYQYVPIQSGSKVKEGTSIRFAVKDGVFVKKWIIGKKKELRMETTYERIAWKKDAVNNGGEFVIKAEIEKREPFDFSIIFDPQKVSCKNGNDTVENKGVVKEGTELTFTALGLQLQDHESILWRFGSGYQWGESGKTTIKYKVRARDASRDDIHEMEISWRKRKM